MHSSLKKIQVVPYNPEWPKQFEDEASIIKQALGENCIDVLHIGSTAVKGLAAKPKIDIIAVVQNTASTVFPLEKAGYTFKGEWNIPFKYGFTRRGTRDVNLHVYEQGHPEIDLNLKFRDYLRQHDDVRDEYARLKYELLEDKKAHLKISSRFPEYTLGKEALIRKILKATGFNQIRMVTATHYNEWSTVKALRNQYFFDPHHITDPYTWTFDHKDHKHWILYKGVDIVGYAHIQLWSQNRAAIRIIVIEDEFRHQGYGQNFIHLIEKWLFQHGYVSVHIESTSKVLTFYEKLGYKPMPFQDPDGYESDPNDSAIGKLL